MPRWAPSAIQGAEVIPDAGGSGRGADKEKGSEPAEKAGKPAASEVRVSDWLAAAAAAAGGAGSGEVRIVGREGLRALA